MYIAHVRRSGIELYISHVGLRCFTMAGGLLQGLEKRLKQTELEIGQQQPCVTVSCDDFYVKWCTARALSIQYMSLMC